MKNIWNCLSCLGVLLLIVGAGMAALFTVAFFYILIVLGQPINGGSEVYTLIATGVIIAIIGASITMFQFSRIRKWNQLVRLAKTKGEITVQEAAEAVGVSPEKARDIIIEAAGEGELSGTISGDVFTRGQPAVITRTEETTLVLIVCPYCGAKNQQGMPRCHSCNSAL